MSGQRIPVSQQQQTVWIVEGAPGEGRSIALALALEPELACEVFATAGAALERLAAGDAPGVLVIDRGASGPAGDEVCRRVRVTHDQLQLPILLTLADRDSESVVSGLAAGANDCLGKPYVAAELVARVRSLASSQRLHRRAVGVEAELAITLRSIGDGVISTGADGCIRFMNQVAADLTGWPAADALGRRLTEVFQILEAETGARIESPIEKVFREGKAVGLANRTLLVRQGGGEVAIDDSAAPIRDEAGALTGIVIVFRDISDKQRAEAEREAARAEAEHEKRKLEAMFDQSPVGIAVLEPPDHTFTFANPAYRMITGREDLVGRRLLEAFPALGGQGFDVLLDGVMATGEPFRGQETAVKLDHHGQDEWLYINFSYQPRRDPAGRIDGVLVSVVDVTEQVLARRSVEAGARALQESEDRLRRVLEASGAGLWDLDVATGAIDADRRMVELMGLPEGASFTLASGLEQLPEEDRDVVVKAIEAALRGDNGGRYLVSFRTGGRDGVPLRWVESRATILFDGGRPVRLAGAMVDITAQKLAELDRQGLIDAIAAQPLTRVAVLRGPELVFEMTNRAYMEQVGPDRDLIGKPIREALPEYVGQPFVPRLLEVMATGVPFVSRESTTYLDRGDGVLVPYHFAVVYQPLRGSSGLIDGVIVLGTDITETVNAREELQSSQARLQQFFEQAPAVVALLDGPEHRFVLANAMYRQLVGGRELVGRPLAEALPEVAEQGFIPLLDEVRRTGVPYRGVEVWLALQRFPGGPLEDVCLNFVYQPVRGIGGAVESIFVHAVDVTEMVRAREQAQRAAEERAGAYDVLEHGDPTFIVDAGWRFTFANAAWLGWTGKRREDVIGQDMWALMARNGESVESAESAESASEYRALYHRAMIERVPVQLTHHDAASNRWSWLSLHPTTDGGLATFIRDVSAEKRAEAELRGRSDFERQLIGIVSHDLRTPLSVIHLGTQTLKARQGMDEKSAKVIARIQSAAERGARMVSDLLDFTQARVGGGIQIAPAQGNLHAILRQVIEDVSTTSGERDIRVEVTGDGQGRWDLDRISQVFMNLLTNAVKYSPPGSVVSVRSESDAAGVTVSIHNTGPEIPPGALSRIFNPMQRATSQLDNRARSVGLGLFIVKHLIEAHGGWIDVTSTAEAGTTFRLWVPRSPGVP